MSDHPCRKNFQITHIVRIVPRIIRRRRCRSKTAERVPETIKKQKRAAGAPSRQKRLDPFSLGSSVLLPYGNV